MSEKRTSGPTNGGYEAPPENGEPQEWQIVKITICLDKKLLEQFDKFWRGQYSSRSEAIRAAIRALMSIQSVESEFDKIVKRLVAKYTALYGLRGGSGGP